jgi:succinoglycan biosynthesis protein ExoV
MKLYFFRGDAPNFGDELNIWLLPKIFPEMFDDDESALFLGIGSILFDDHPKDRLKIVFGSGYGGYTPPPAFDDNWKIYCVRGPRTAKACNLSTDYIAADTAILIARHRAKTARSSGYSFMPHWESAERGNWALACARSGIRFIDPRSAVEDVLQSIETSAVLITEALHGAIVADALRVPWIPVLPFHRAHRMKWFDWAEALDVSISHHAILPSSTREARGSRTQAHAIRLKDPKGLLKLGVAVLDRMFVHAAASRLKRVAKQSPMLSSDAALERALERLETCARRVRMDYLDGKIQHAK